MCLRSPTLAFGGHPQMSQDGTFSGNKTMLDFLSGSLYLLPSSLLYPCAKGYCSVMVLLINMKVTSALAVITLESRSGHN